MALIEASASDNDVGSAVGTVESGTESSGPIIIDMLEHDKNAPSQEVELDYNGNPTVQDMDSDMASV